MFILAYFVLICCIDESELDRLLQQVPDEAINIEILEGCATLHEDEGYSIFYEVPD